MKKNNHLQKNIGEILRNKREELGFSLNDVYAGIKVKVEYLEAIEKAEFDLFPAEVYVRGYVRNYAKFLGLDPIHMLKVYKRDRAHQNYGYTIEQTKDEVQETIALENSRRNFSIIVVIALVVISATAFAVFSIINTRKPNLELFEPVLVNAQETNIATIDTTEEEISITGKIAAGDKLFLNDAEVETFGLTEFVFPIKNIPEGESTWLVKTKNQFGVENTIELRIIRSGIVE